MNTKALIIVILVFIVLLAFLGFMFYPKNGNQEEENQDSLNNQTASSEQTLPPTNVKELKVEDLKIGEGSEVKSGDQIVIHYNGTLENGTKFDSSYDAGRPFETQIGVGNVIEGWDKGVVGMKIGGKRKLTIPPSMGYGESGYPPRIPPNAALIFEVELVDIK